MDAGDETLESALRELREELGIEAAEDDLTEVGIHRGKFEAVFHGRLFKDNELSTVYLYQKPVDITTLTLQESEVSEVIWMDFSECREKIKNKSLPNCIYLEEFDMIGEKLGILSEKNI